jgi:pyruvate, orthophosphate dikinase
MTKQWVYRFSEGSKEQKMLLGGKGANLSEMTNLGLPIPPGFTISTESCIHFFDEGRKLWPALNKQIETALTELEETVGKSFHDPANPLLVSVRSGSAFSMPGMMDTILNLGLNDKSVEGLAEQTQNPTFAYDSYRRFIQMFGDVVKNVSRIHFESILDTIKHVNGYEFDNQLTLEDLTDLIRQYKDVYLRETGESFPQEPMDQLRQSIQAVFASWNNERAILYRNIHHIAHDLGTAVNVQSMVFGNRGDDSGTGVAFTRNPATGEKKLFGEFLMNAQGEDVVAGIRTPLSIDSLQLVMPAVYTEFKTIAEKLEEHYRDMQDIEFTIEKGKLYLLQTRNGKRTATAAISVAVDLVNEGILSKEEAVLRIETGQLDQLLHPTFDEKALPNAILLATGLGASPGAASGHIYFSTQDAEEANKQGIPVILVRRETSPEDLAGMVSSEGILTARGGMTSHAAVVARGLGKCCVAGCTAAVINEDTRTVIIGDIILHQGDILSIDGATGRVYAGNVPKQNPTLSGDFNTFMSWVNDIKQIGVKANADSPADLRQALALGAEGIGLCRTEHMFFHKDRIPAMRKMILARSVEERKKYLSQLLGMQRQDFYEMFALLQEKPMTVRLLDPPLHEFLPVAKEDKIALADAMDTTLSQLEEHIDSLHEVNPMLGHRGCRLAVTYPEIYRMQARAIIEGALQAAKETGSAITPEIMIPLVCDVDELRYVKSEIQEEMDEVFIEQNNTIPYHIGTMIEIPRAAVTSDEIATEADFFSFGTNDMTQMGFGFSRDDSGKFLQEYEDKGLLKPNPFHSLDVKGIGKLVKLSATLGREANPDLVLGVCGEHGGDPRSIAFFYSIGLDYVSCSPFRVPIARLAAAQETIKQRKLETLPEHTKVKEAVH